MLGVGGGTAINILKKRYPKIFIRGVDIDPEIVNLSLKSKLFQKDRLNEFEIADALTWVIKDKQRYDLIVVDLYLGALNPDKARQKPFLLQVKSLLKKDGIILYNCHYQKGHEADYKVFRGVTDEVFSQVEEIFIYPKNKILLFTR